MNSMIYEIESIFDKPEISFEDISELQYMDIMYEGKVTEFIKSSYDKGKKLVSAIWNKMKEIVKKFIDSRVIKSILNKLKSMKNWVTSKLKSSEKEATEAFDLFGIEAASKYDASVVEAINHMISVIVSVCVVYGSAELRSAYKGSSSLVGRAFYGGLFGLLLSIVVAGPLFLFSTVLGVGVLAIVVMGGAGFAINHARSNSEAGTRSMLYMTLASYLAHILTKESIYRVVNDVFTLTEKLFSVFKKGVSDENVESAISKILQKNNWISESDINVRNPAKLEKTIDKKARDMIAEYKKKVQNESLDRVNELMNSETPWDDSLKTCCISCDKLMKFINKNIKAGEAYKAMATYENDDDE